MVRSSHHARNVHGINLTVSGEEPAVAEFACLSRIGKIFSWGRGRGGECPDRHGHIIRNVYEPFPLTLTNPTIVTSDLKSLPRPRGGTAKQVPTDEREDPGAVYETLT